MNGPGRKKMSNRMKGLLAVLVALAMVLSFVSGLVFVGRKTPGQLVSEGERFFSEASYDRAIAAYRKALEQNPDMPDVYNRLGMAYRMKYRETREAAYRSEEVKAFRKALSLDPRNVQAHVNLGTTLLEMNKREEASRYLKKALELQPDHPDRAEIEELVRKAEGH